MLKIRPHHLICMQLYVGKGYSTDFNQNMNSVINRLESEEEFELTDSADSICSKCPNLKNGVCRDNDKVERFDSGVLEYLKLDLSEKYTFENIKNFSEICKVLDYVCADCNWNKSCKDIYKNKSEVKK